MTDLTLTLSQIESRIRQLMQAQSDLRMQSKKLEIEVSDLQKIIDHQNHKINELENKIKVQSISRGFATGEDSTKAKQAIQEYVREIDKCIQLLDR